MNSIAGSQTRTFLALLAEFGPSIRTDRNLPARVHQRLARERSFGSRDRRLYRELLYTAFRYWPWVEALRLRSEDELMRAVVWLASEIPATRALKETILQGWPPTAASVPAQAQQLGMTASVVPEWFEAHCAEAFISPNREVLQSRAPLWLRVQTDDPAPIFAEFSGRGWAWRVSDILPSALELLVESDVTQTDAYKQGLIEIQDLGSQLLLASVQPRRGERWFDACAGAGGKTLQLARLLGPHGHVDAYDPRNDALEELRRRVQRAQLGTISVRYEIPTEPLYDGVLVDAPCSGSGTWRRAPHLKWCTKETDIAAAAERQTEILHRFSSLVRSGGSLVYATCSLSSRENEDVIARFLANHPEFLPAKLTHPFPATVRGEGRLFLPAQHNTDGFFVAALQKS